jgi:hypothetical protein
MLDHFLCSCFAGGSDDVFSAISERKRAVANQTMMTGTDSRTHGKVDLES